ncbi:Release factor glutamine methyltransferase [Rubripirellula obstinata]|uniref:Release factor glutamine methyltransferase n=1 Tax=Rubripirellula obstinata TaxID=406547 RepID=A0A5B1CJ23_9BACT|nr:methyltransferase [Rubripirellula obstinata]KAA1259729.1 Release factor glutamine methyltransferase [Rubripirellula obstinata]
MKTCFVPFLAFLLITGCDSRFRDDLDYSYDVVQSWTIEEIPSGDLVQFESVDFDLIASVTIRQAIAKDNVAASRDVLHIGSGVGLISAMCLNYEAKSVVATDIHPAAVSNTRYNVAALAPDGKLTTRLRPASKQDAFSAIESDEKFDLIITDLDQNHRLGEREDDGGLRTFAESFFGGFSSHLNSGGRAIVICSKPETLNLLLQTCKANGLKAKSLEEDFENRDWESADSPMIPAVLFEVRPDAGTPVGTTAQHLFLAKHGN